MIFCSHCGSQEQDGAQFCQSCGAPIGAASTGAAPTQPNQYNPHVATQSNDAEENKGMAILAYILFFIPLLTGDFKKSPFVKYHTNQGILLFITYAALGIATQLIRSLLWAILRGAYTWLGVYGMLNTLLNVLWIAPMVLFVLGVINAANGRTKPLPVIGELFTIIK